MYFAAVEGYTTVPKKEKNVVQQFLLLIYQHCLTKFIFLEARLYFGAVEGYYNRVEKNVVHQCQKLMIFSTAVFYLSAAIMYFDAIEG